jgi:hypothetical protein
VTVSPDQRYGSFTKCSSFRFILEENWYYLQKMFGVCLLSFYISRSLKFLAAFLAAVFIWSGPGTASANNADLNNVQAGDKLCTVLPDGYETEFQPFTSHTIPWKIKEAGFKDLCMKDAFPSAVLPAFQAKIIGIRRDGFILAVPRVASPLRFFLKSVAKLGWSYYETGRYALVKDKADSPAGELDSIPASGMYALALSAAQTEHLVSRDEAIRVLRMIHDTVKDRTVMPRAYGILPHFVRWKKNRYVSVAEYSTVDTALYYHSMLIASEILGQSDVASELRKEIEEMNFVSLTVGHGPNKGFITMGVERDGKTIMENSVWNFWGGESALVLLLEKMSGERPEFPVPADPDRAGSTGNVFEGRGFIAEIQSLFYPQFNSDRPDKLTGQYWLMKRRQLLRDQVESTVRYFPGSKAAEDGLYGYSCGEVNKSLGSGCGNYCENGIRDGKNRPVKPRPVIFPHYIMMSSQASKDPAEQVHELKILEREGLFPPWGLVESCNVDLTASLPMMGSLNASFEAISAYHLLCRIEGRPDVIYSAASSMPFLKRAMEIFY